MAVSKPEQSQNAFSLHSREQIQRAEANLVRCLVAFEEKGDPGLYAELDRIQQPSPNLTRLGLRVVPFMAGSHSIVSDKSYLQTENIRKPDSSTPKPKKNPG